MGTVLQFFTQTHTYPTFGPWPISSYCIAARVVAGSFGIIDMEKTMKKTIVGILAIVVLVGGAIFVVAQRSANNGTGEFGGRRGGPHMGMMFLRGLDLTDDQKAKVKEITEASRTNIQPLAQQLRDGHQKLEALGTDGSFDQAKVEALAAEQSALMGKMIVEKERTKAQIFAILTDEQKAKAAELKKNRPERGKGHKGFGGGFGRGFGGPAGSDAQ